MIRAENHIRRSLVTFTMHRIWGLYLSLVVSPIAGETCMCGYAMTDDYAHESGRVVFTDMLVTDFTSLNDISQNTDWTRQQFNVSAEAGRGTFGKSFQVGNVFSFPGSNVPGHQDLMSDAKSQRAMALRVGSLPTDIGAISAAEIDSNRNDMFWGSYRVVMKLPRNSGTCSAFFWYRNDTQEIDMEFLSREFDPATNVFPVNLVIHSRLSMQNGYDASKSGTLRRVKLSFDPTSSFHEYRFDYLPGRVTFYADGLFLAGMKGDDVPSSGGHIILQHWSNGNPLWSGGPPSSDAVVLVSSVKAYFNSSKDGHKDEKWNDECSNREEKGKMCVVSSKSPENGSSNANHTDDNQARPTAEADSQGCHATVPTVGRLASLMVMCALPLPRMYRVGRHVS